MDPSSPIRFHEQEPEDQLQIYTHKYYDVETVNEPSRFKWTKSKCCKVPGSFFIESIFVIKHWMTVFVSNNSDISTQTEMYTESKYKCKQTFTNMYTESVFIHFSYFWFVC